MALKEKKRTSGEAWHRLLREVYLLEKTLRHVTEKVHEETGLTSSQRQILRLLITKGEATIPDIARERKVSRQSSQIMINDMIDRDLLKRDVNPKHKSSYLISITERGRLQFERARKREDAILAEKLSRVKADPDGVDDAADLLCKVRDILEKEI